MHMARIVVGFTASAALVVIIIMAARNSQIGASHVQAGFCSEQDRYLDDEDFILAAIGYEMEKRSGPQFDSYVDIDQYARSNPGCCYVDRDGDYFADYDAGGDRFRLGPFNIVVTVVKLHETSGTRTESIYWLGPCGEYLTGHYLEYESR